MFMLLLSVSHPFSRILHRDIFKNQSIYDFMYHCMISELQCNKWQHYTNPFIQLKQGYPKIDSQILQVSFVNRLTFYLNVLHSIIIFKRTSVEPYPMSIYFISCKRFRKKIVYQSNNIMKKSPMTLIYIVKFLTLNPN